MKIKGKGMFDTWWKIALWTVGGIFAFLAILGAVIGLTPIKATADGSVKACRSSDYAPGPEFLDSRSSTKPDGTWTPVEVGTDGYTMSQKVRDDNAIRPSSAVWICSANMAKDGLWTVTWTSGTSYRMVWYVKNDELRSVAMPRDLSGPGYG